MGQDSTTVYSGTFERAMDAKKRVAVPASWLGKEEGEILHVCPHPKEGYLMVMPPVELERYQAKIEASALSPVGKRHAIRKFFSEAHTVTTDKQGRIVLSEKHCERAGLSGDVVFMGTGSRFEIWSPERLAAADAEQTDAYLQAAEAIGL